MKTGLIIKNISNQYTCLVEGEEIVCIPKGKFKYDKITPLVGDYCKVDKENKIIKDILPRKNELARPNVANIDYALIVTSVKEPNLSLNLLDKQLVAVEKQKIIPIILMTKLDLLNKSELKSIKEIIKYYKKIGYIVLTNNNLFQLKRKLKGKVVVLTGQTGAGKSTLINRLDKTKNVKTSEISKSLGRGVHTTRNTEIYNVKNVYIVDTPGFSSLDIKDIKPDEVKNYFKEFKSIKCEFKDCTHEDNCNVKKAVDMGIIKKSRYDNYLRIIKECYETSGKLFK